MDYRCGALANDSAGGSYLHVPCLGGGTCMLDASKGEQCINCEAGWEHDIFSIPHFYNCSLPNGAVRIFVICVGSMLALGTIILIWLMFFTREPLRGNARTAVLMMKACVDTSGISVIATYLSGGFFETSMIWVMISCTFGFCIAPFITSVLLKPVASATNRLPMLRKLSKYFWLASIFDIVILYSLAIVAITRCRDENPRTYNLIMFVWFLILATVLTIHCSGVLWVTYRLERLFRATAKIDGGFADALRKRVNGSIKQGPNQPTGGDEGNERMSRATELQVATKSRDDSSYDSAGGAEQAHNKTLPLSPASKDDEHALFNHRIASQTTKEDPGTQPGGLVVRNSSVRTSSNTLVPRSSFHRQLPDAKKYRINLIRKQLLIIAIVAAIFLFNSLGIFMVIFTWAATGSFPYFWILHFSFFGSLTITAPFALPFSRGFFIRPSGPSNRRPTGMFWMFSSSMSSRKPLDSFMALHQEGAGLINSDPASNDLTTNDGDTVILVPLVTTVEQKRHGGPKGKTRRLIQMLYEPHQGGRLGTFLSNISEEPHTVASRQSVSSAPAVSIMKDES